MKRLLSALLALTLSTTLSAQQVYRTEFSVYDTREDALKGDHSKTERHIRFAPKRLEVVDNIVVLGQTLNMPTAWSDYNIYLHLQNCIKGYDIVVNQELVKSIEDTVTPMDFDITSYLKQGDNEILILSRPSSVEALEAGVREKLAEPFRGSYIFAQHRKHIYDYEARIVQVGKSLQLELDIIARNDFNFEESMQVGYDIYAPDGKLVDYAVREISVPGRSVDTLRIRTSLGEESRFLWSNAKPQLYRLTLYTKRDGKPREYNIFHLGAGTTTLSGKKILRNGKEVVVNSARYDTQVGYAEALEKIKMLRSRGFNTLTPATPQPEWFYDICDKLGMYVIEQANINPTAESQNRKVGGTPSNNVELMEEYLSRVKSMYYRTRNHSCIIAYSLGGKMAGNGYNMYKAYQWLKGVEKDRAIICQSADGEWNSDL